MSGEQEGWRGSLHCEQSRGGACCAWGLRSELVPTGVHAGWVGMPTASYTGLRAWRLSLMENQISAGDQKELSLERGSRAGLSENSLVWSQGPISRCRGSR